MDVKVLVAERGFADLEEIEEIIPTSDVILTKGLKTTAAELTLEDATEGQHPLTDLVNTNTSVEDLSDVEFDTAGPQEDQILQYDSGSGVWKNVDNISESLFGSNITFIENLVAASTNSTSPVQRLRLSVTSLSATATYVLFWSYTWRYTSTSNDFIARIQRNDTVTVWTHDQEAKDTAVTQREPANGFALFTGLSGSHDFDLDYWSESASATAFIYNARMMFWRVM